VSDRDQAGQGTSTPAAGPGHQAGTGTAPRPTAWDWQPFPRDCLRCGAPLGPGLGSRCQACGWKESET